VPAAPPSPGPTTTHTGRAYTLGYDESSFAISRLLGGAPVERFERTEDGWRRAWDRFQQLDRRDAVPAWRQRTAPWILLNVAISIAAWLAILLVDGVVLAATDRETEEISTTAGIGIGLALPLTIAGWLLYAYAANLQRRRLALAVLVGGALVLVIVTSLVDQPAA